MIKLCTRSALSPRTKKYYVNYTISPALMVPAFDNQKKSTIKQSSFFNLYQPYITSLLMITVKSVKSPWMMVKSHSRNNLPMFQRSSLDRRPKIVPRRALHLLVRPAEPKHSSHLRRLMRLTLEL